MIKIIDVDALFDKYISDFVYSNIGKVKPEEIENQIPALYVEFGDKEFKELDGKTPNTYYRDFTVCELLDCLKSHLEKGVSVSDFLCEAITQNPNNEDELIKYLDQENGEEMTLYVMNMLSDMESKKTANKYLEFVLWDYSESIRELATEELCKNADAVKDRIVEQFNEAEEFKKDSLCEILSNASRDDKIFEILINRFLVSQNKIPMYAAFLSKYGDEKALPYLLTAIENPKINYADFEELRFAIEALGGEYNKIRDFSADKTYKKIKSIKKN